MTTDPRPASEPGKFKFTVIDLCPGCRRWLIHPNGMPIEPLLPRNVHVLPETVGGGIGT